MSRGWGLVRGNRVCKHYQNIAKTQVLRNYLQYVNCFTLYDRKSADLVFFFFLYKAMCAFDLRVFSLDCQPDSTPDIFESTRKCSILLLTIVFQQQETDTPWLTSFTIQMSRQNGKNKWFQILEKSYWKHNSVFSQWTKINLLSQSEVYVRKWI